MSFETGLRPEQLNAIIDELVGGVQLDDWGERFQAFTPPVGWQLVTVRPEDSIIVDKIKVASDKLFAKMYAPIAGDYTEKAALIFEELSLLHTSIPILKPEVVRRGVLLFVRGRFTTKVSLTSLEPDGANKIGHIVKSRDLKPLDVNYLVDVIEIHDQQFVVDPFDDSTAAIENYIQTHQK